MEEVGNGNEPEGRDLDYSDSHIYQIPAASSPRIISSQPDMSGELTQGSLLKENIISDLCKMLTAGKEFLDPATEKVNIYIIYTFSDTK